MYSQHLDRLILAGVEASLARSAAHALAARDRGETLNFAQLAVINEAALATWANS